MSLRLPRVTFVHPDGACETHTAAAGSTVLDCALDHHVAGLLGRCAGGCSCTTCHGYFPPPWFGLLPPMGADERELLEYVLEPRAHSRLCCQVELSDALDGVTVHLPVRQV